MTVETDAEHVRDLKEISAAGWQAVDAWVKRGVRIDQLEAEVERLRQRETALLGTIREAFSARGIGCDWSPGCFVCGGEPGLYTNVAGFVQNKGAGERVVALFERGAWLDYRPSEPKWIQVKIGACSGHEANISWLVQETVADDHHISYVIVRTALDRTEQPAEVSIKS